MSTIAENITDRRMALFSTIAYFASFVSLGLCMAVIGPTLPSLAENTNATLGSISILLAIRAFGYLIGSMAGGWLYDRQPGHPIVMAMLFLMGLSLLLVPMIHTLWLMVALFFFIGVVQSVLDVGCNTLLVWIHGNKVGPFMNALHFTFGVGAFIAPVIVAQVVARTDAIDWAYRIIAILIMLPALFMLRLPSPTSDKTPGRAENPGVQDVWLLVFFAIFFFFYVGGEASYGDWIFTYGTRSGLVDENMGAYMTSAFWGIFTFARLVSIPLAARFRPAAILLANTIGSVVGMLLLVFAGHSLPALWVGTLVVGFSIASSFPTMFSMAEESMHISGRVTSIFFVGASLGGILFPWLIGQLFEAFGPPSMMRVIAACMGMTLLALALIRLRVRRKLPAAQEI